LVEKLVRSTFPFNELTTCIYPFLEAPLFGTNRVSGAAKTKRDCPPGENSMEKIISKISLAIYFLSRV
jgi:hypothetical protein